MKKVFYVIVLVMLCSLLSASFAEGLFDDIVEDAKASQELVYPTFSEFSGRSYDRQETEDQNIIVEYGAVDLDTFQAFGSYLSDKGYTVSSSDKKDSSYILQIQNIQNHSMVFEVLFDVKNQCLITVYPIDAGILNGNETLKEPEQETEYDVLDIPPIETKSLVIDPIQQNAYRAEKAEILTFTGRIGSLDQIDTYSFTAPFPGCYRIEINGLLSGVKEELHLFDYAGNVISRKEYCTNGSGITASNLNGGETYYVTVQQHRQSGDPKDTIFSAYTLSIGLQKAGIDISGLTRVSDSTEFVDQIIHYGFLVPRDGTYRFEFSEMMNDTVIQLRALNALGEVIRSKDYCRNGGGITLEGLKKGEWYDLVVRQEEGLSDYSMAIGYQKDTVDISLFTQVTDSVEFTDQINLYTFTVPMEGRYRLELSEMMNGTNTKLRVLNRLGEKVAFKDYCVNGSGVTLDNLVVGETYQIQVIQEKNFSGYVLLIGQQKDTVGIRSGMIVHDRIEYTDQKNVYEFTASEKNNVDLTIEGMQAGTTVELYVFNELGEVLASDRYVDNHETLTVEKDKFETGFEVQVRQGNGAGSYSLIID